MTTLSLSPQIVTYLDSIEGQTPDDKLLSLLETYLAAQIRACEREISQYEVLIAVQVAAQQHFPNSPTHAQIIRRTRIKVRIELGEDRFVEEPSPKQALRRLREVADTL